MQLSQQKNNGNNYHVKHTQVHCRSSLFNLKAEIVQKLIDVEGRVVWVLVEALNENKGYVVEGC